MAHIQSFPRDDRPSALYLLAHQGPLRDPRPAEVQHMRIRRYMDLLRELRGVNHHYSEPHDIYVDFNLTGSGDFPGFMRLGEAIGQYRYRSVFVDLAAGSSFPGSSLRDIADSKIRYSLKQLPVEVIDVSLDPAGVLLERLEKLSKHYGWTMGDHLADDAHDIVCFFPGLSAKIARAIFFRHDERHNVLDLQLNALEQENPYSGGREPWLPQTLWCVYSQYELEHREKSEAARRAAGETLYRIEPEREALLIDEGLWCSEGARAAESMVFAEQRLAAFGFEKVVNGQTVSFSRSAATFVLFADPRSEGKIRISIYRAQAPKGKRGKPCWIRVGSGMTIPDKWWRGDQGSKFQAYLEKNLPQDEKEPRSR